MKTSAKNFISPLHTICAKDEIRPTLNHIYFKDGCAVATDGHILIQQSLELHNMMPEDIEALEGKMIHRKVFAEIYKYDSVNFTQTDIEVVTPNGTIKYPYATITDEYPDFNNVIPIAEHKKEMLEIGLNAEYLAKLTKVLKLYNTKDDVKLMFHGNKGILVYTLPEQNHKNMGLVMPVMLHE